MSWHVVQRPGSPDLLWVPGVRSLSQVPVEPTRVSPYIILGDPEHWAAAQYVSGRAARYWQGISAPSGIWVKKQQGTLLTWCLSTYISVAPSSLSLNVFTVCSTCSALVWCGRKVLPHYFTTLMVELKFRWKPGLFLAKGRLGFHLLLFRQCFKGERLLPPTVTKLSQHADEWKQKYAVFFIWNASSIFLPWNQYTNTVEVCGMYFFCPAPAVSNVIFF